MIPNHAQFIDALREKRKVRVRFYSAPDSGVLDRVCAPLDYGPGAETNDGLNRYWFRNYAAENGSCKLGLVPQQIVGLHVLGDVFDPAQLNAHPAPVPAAPASDLPP